MLSIRLHAKPLTDYFSHLMYRQYISDNSVWGGGRPQFLFAEPSYIGMHLFGILLPLMWLMRGRDRIYAKRLRDSSSRMPSARCSCKPAPESSSIPSWRC